VRAICAAARMAVMPAPRQLEFNRRKRCFLLVQSSRLRHKVGKGSRGTAVTKILSGFALALALMLGALPAAAQTAAPPARSAEADAKVALVRRYFAAIQFDKLMNGMIESMLQNILADPRIPAEKREVIEDVALESFAAVLPGYMDRVVAVYAEEFTREELVAVVEFYESPVGRALTARSVILTRRTGELMDYFRPAFEADMQRRLCDRIGCEPEVVPTSKR